MPMRMEVGNEPTEYRYRFPLFFCPKNHIECPPETNKPQLIAGAVRIRLQSHAAAAAVNKSASVHGSLAKPALTAGVVLIV